jgi:hypothetical protein
MKKKLMLLVAMLAMMMLTATPVLAEVEVGFDDQELESGDIDSETDISIDGNNNNQCVGLSQVNNTGNFANQQGTSQDGGSNGFFFDDDDNHIPTLRDRDGHFFGFSGDDDNGEFEQEFEGPEVTFAPENETACDQAVQQSSAASSWGW